MEKTILKVEGMSCEHCVKAVTTAVKALQGVTDVSISLAEKTVAVSHDGSATVEQLKTAIEDQGYDVLG